MDPEIVGNMDPEIVGNMDPEIVGNMVCTLYPKKVPKERVDE